MSPLYVVLLLCPAMTYALLDLTPYNDTALEFFHHMDTTGAGQLVKTDIIKYFEEYDADKNGTATLAEFTAHLDADHPRLKGYESEVMKFYDFTKDGVLEQDDFVYMFDVYDFNGDNIVTQEEFVNDFSVFLAKLEAEINAGTST